MDSRLSRWCAGLLEAGWLIAILAVPLFFNIQSERVFEPDKLALLRSLVLVMAAVWLVGFIDRRGWRQRDWLRPSHPDAIWHRPLVLPVLALVIVYVLASLFSVSPRVSWLGSYQRLQGTYTTLSYVVVFALMASTIRTPGQVRRVITVAIVTSIPVALYGLLQHFGQDPLPWGGDVEVRVAGHMGNAIFIAAYLIMIVPLTLGRAVDALSGILNEERLAAADVARASAYLFTLAIQLLTIYWSGSRGPLIGLGVGLFADIDADVAGLRLVSELARRRAAAGENAGHVAVLAVVDERDRIVDRVEREQGHHRAKDLGTRDCVLGSHAIEDRRAQEEAALATGDRRIPAVDQERRALVEAGLDQALDAQLALRRDDRAHVHALVEAKADDALFGRLGQHRSERLFGAGNHDDVGRR